jgi:ketosteroid isomerase-like protein
MNAVDFPRRFAAAFVAQDVPALVGLVANGGTALTLTGAWAETPAEIEQAFAAEIAGIFARAKLVTGKGTMRMLGPNSALLRQRYMVSGAIDETGAELPRFAAMLIVVLERQDSDWLAQSLSFTATG